MKIGLVFLIFGIALSGCKERDLAADCENDTNGKIGAFVAAEFYVRDRLRSPSTAEFPSFSAKGVLVNYVKRCHFTVVSYVDAQNAFGATVRTRYIVNIEADPNSDGHRASGLVME